MREPLSLATIAILAGLTAAALVAPLAALSLPDVIYLVLGVLLLGGL